MREGYRMNHSKDQINSSIDAVWPLRTGPKRKTGLKGRKVSTRVMLALMNAVLVLFSIPKFALSPTKYSFSKESSLPSLILIPKIDD